MTMRVFIIINLLVTIFQLVKGIDRSRSPAHLQPA